MSKQENYENLMFIRNGFISINPSCDSKEVEFSTDKRKQKIATILMNLASYGFTMSMRGIAQLSSLSDKKLAIFWNNIEPVFKEITGNKHDISNHIVYKNFPKEVLEMSHSEYWLRQIFIYLGADYDLVRQSEEKREDINPQELHLKVLHVVGLDTEKEIFKNLVSMKNRWSFNQKEDATYLHSIHESYIVLSDFGFKENGLELMVHMYNLQKEYNEINNSLYNRLPENQKKIFSSMSSCSVLHQFVIEDSTDVVRLCSGISGCNVSLREKVLFKNFSRKERKIILSMLENSKNLSADVALRKQLFKKLFSRLHPGDYDFKKVSSVYDLVYNNNTEKTFNAKLNELYNSSNIQLLDHIKTRPGVFVREFHRIHALYGSLATSAFIEILDQLDTIQLVKFKSYLNTVNTRELYVYAPKGNWNRAQFNKMQKTQVEDADEIIANIDTILGNRIKKRFGDGFSASEELKKVKLQTNDQKLAEYGRGTVFNIPENITFIRTASFWDSKNSSFLDNTWNFFDENWNSLGVCCWNSPSFNGAAIFSGDAVNTNGKAAQLIDIYFDQLKEQGVKYAVWSILSFSKIPLKDFNEAYAGLQLGEEPQKGKQFDPARNQFSFEINKENTLAKVVAYVDVETRELIYVDINRSFDVQSGEENVAKLSTEMPYLIAYMESLPSIYDLLSVTEGKIPAVYSDKGISFEDGIESAYIFKPENESTDLKILSMSELILV